MPATIHWAVRESPNANVWSSRGAGLRSRDPWKTMRGWRIDIPCILPPLGIRADAFIQLRVSPGREAVVEGPVRLF